MKRKREKTWQELQTERIAKELQAEADRHICASAIRREGADKVFGDQVMGRLEQQVEEFIKASERPYSDTEADLLRRLAGLRLEVRTMSMRKVDSGHIVTCVRRALEEAVQRHLPGF